MITHPLFFLFSEQNASARRAYVNPLRREKVRIWNFPIFPDFSVSLEHADEWNQVKMPQISDLNSVGEQNEQRGRKIKKDVLVTSISWHRSVNLNGFQSSSLTRYFALKSCEQITIQNRQIAWSWRFDFEISTWRRSESLANLGQWLTFTQSMKAIFEWVRFTKGVIVLRSPRASSAPVDIQWFWAMPFRGPLWMGLCWHENRLMFLWCWVRTCASLLNQMSSW